MTPRLSVQIVTWNSAATIGACLDSLAAQELRDFEVVVVDNASADGSADVVEGRLRGGLAGRLARSSRNLGFCGGQNRATDMTRGEWVLFLNPDAELSPAFVRHAIEVFEGQGPDVGSIVPRILLPDGRIESTGLLLDRFRRARDRGHGNSPDGAFLVEEDVMGGTGAVVLHRRAMLEDVSVGGRALDENLFAYYDDLDLALRARLRGWRCRYVPSLVAMHRRAGRNALLGLPGRRAAAREQALMVRNRLLVMAKCEPLGDLVRDLPALAAFEVARMAYLAIRSPGALRGYAGALTGLPAALRARRAVREPARRSR